MYTGLSVKVKGQPGQQLRKPIYLQGPGRLASQAPGMSPSPRAGRGDARGGGEHCPP